MSKNIIVTANEPYTVEIPSSSLIGKIIIGNADHYWIGFDSSSDGCKNTITLINYEAYELKERK